MSGKSEGNTLSHVDSEGKARMVDVSGKSRIRRTAKAYGKILLKPDTLDLIRKNSIAKGDVLATARIAGIMAAKRTSDLIPLCHPIEIDRIDIDFEIGEDSISISGVTACTDRTGIEMEAITAVAITAVTIYDMCKAVDDSMTITEIRLIEKTKSPLDRDDGA